MVLSESQTQEPLDPRAQESLPTQDDDFMLLTAGERILEVTGTAKAKLVKIADIKDDGSVLGVLVVFESGYLGSIEEWSKVAEVISIETKRTRETYSLELGLYLHKQEEAQTVYLYQFHRS